MYEIKRLWLAYDKKAQAKWRQLLEKNNLQSQESVTLTLGMYHHNQLIGTISLDHNIIKCVAIDPNYQSDNLLATLVTHILDIARQQNLTHLFVYTKHESSKYFASLGFKKIIDLDQLSFMEFGKPDFQDYLSLLKRKAVPEIENTCAIVMNANPFTKGHQHLVTLASKAHTHVYVFVLSEERAQILANDRMAMVQLGVKHLTNVTVLPTRDYLVSQATFPSYFLKEKAELAIAKVHAQLDATLFKEAIAPQLAIQTRYVGEEPFSPVTAVYNQAMQDVFGDTIKLVIVPRLEVGDQQVSATHVRQAMKDQNLNLVKSWVPETTYQYLMTHNYI